MTIRALVAIGALVVVLRGKASLIVDLYWDSTLEKYHLRGLFDRV
jgi:hypothetical protein